MIIRASFTYQCIALLGVVQARELEFPKVWDTDENADIKLDLDWVEIDPGFGGSAFKTRALGGSVPGPTIKLSAGTTVNVHFRNLLKEQPGSYKTTDPGRFNLYGDADYANLHFHGGHVSSVLPADDTTLVVPPGQHYNFSVPFGADHAPGLNWLHPHHHGSSSLHLMGGAALALIVKDPPGTLPKEVEDAEEKVLVFQDWDVPQGRNIARKAGDAIFASNLDLVTGGEDVGQRFVTINGMYQPTLTVSQGVWQRWRMLYAGWQDLPLNFRADSNGADCEFQLLAKDGIYIADYPRVITGDIPIPPGGRADFMVRCNNVGTTNMSAMTRDALTVVSQKNDISVAGTAVGRDSLTGESATEDSQNVTQIESPVLELSAWQPPSLPEYLQSVMEVPPSDGCTCPYVLKGYDDTSRLNGETYRPGNHFQHTTYLGAVVQRDLNGIDEHSYHQHIYPYQLIEGFIESEYFKYGDWHDSLLDVSGKLKSGLTTWVIRYRTTGIPGKMMVHCHNTMHADHGMLGKEYIRDLESGGSCECKISGPISGPGLVDDVEKIKVVGAIEGVGTVKVGTVKDDEKDDSGSSYLSTMIVTCIVVIMTVYSV